VAATLDSAMGHVCLKQTAATLGSAMGDVCLKQTENATTPL